jgi:DNA polymerase elongation subunit (family B)
MDPYEAAKIATNAARDLLADKYKIEDLIVSKSLKRIAYVSEVDNSSTKNYVEADGFYLQHEYKNSNMPHITVAVKREERLRGSGPKSGDRVPYIFVETKNPKDLQYLKAEDPQYAKDEGLKPDLKYYLEHSLSSPLQSLFELFYENPNEILFADVLQEFEAKKNRMVNLLDLIN